MIIWSQTWQLRVIRMDKEKIGEVNLHQTAQVFPGQMALLGGSCYTPLTLNSIAMQAETVYLSWQSTSILYQLGDLSKTTDPQITIK